MTTPSQPADASRDPIASDTQQPKRWIRSLHRKVVDEAKEFFAFLCYLIFVYGTLIVFAANIYSPSFGNAAQIPVYRFFGLAFVNAIVVAKLVVLGRGIGVGHGQLGRYVRKKSLAAIILYQSAVFSLLLLVVHIMEDFAWAALRLRPLSATFLALMNSAPQLVSFGWVLFVVMIPYFTYHEVGRVLQPGVLPSFLFRRQGQASPSCGAGPDSTEPQRREPCDAATART